jgi:hypothetical protein
MRISRAKKKLKVHDERPISPSYSRSPHRHAASCTHDAAANLDYQFDQETRLTGAAGYTYTYDGHGNRVIKSGGNTASSGTLYWYMTPGVIAESDLLLSVSAKLVLVA